MRLFIKLIDQKGLSLALLLLTDIVGYFVSFLIAYYIRAVFLVEYFHQTTIHHLDVYVNEIPVAFILLFIVFYFFGLYERKNRVSGVIETYHVLRAVTFCWILIMALSFLQKYDYSRELVIIFWIVSLLVLSFGRNLFRYIKLLMYKNGKWLTHVLIVGAGKTGRKLKTELDNYGNFGYKIIGFIDDSVQFKKGSNFNLLGGLNDLRKIIRRQKIDEVFIVDPALSYETTLGLMHQCSDTNVRFKVVSGLFEVVSGGIDINELEGIPSLDMKKTDDNLLYLFLKRLMDIFISLIGLVLFLPLWLFIGLGIKLTSSGPVIFKHKRIGLGGKEFMIWKFRTMYSNVKKQEIAPKTKKDKRITSIGRFLRKTSLDEIPQFWNVLKGEMSIVGPRPEMPFIVKTYSNWQRRRLDVKPGITGLWQILGRKDLPLHENIEYDFYYINNRSLLLDFVIIIKTFLVITTSKGAY